MTTSYKTYEQMKQNCPQEAHLVDWAVKAQQSKNKSMTVAADHINEDGSLTKVFSSFNTKSSNDRIDGHFWIEDLNGRRLSDCGFNAYKHQLPCFSNPNFWNEETDFIVYQPVPDAEMEQFIIDGQVKKKVKNWGQEVSDLFHDTRTEEERFKVVARRMWANRDTMLSGGFECLQTAVCEHLYLTEKGVECRIRFGCAGIVRPDDDMVFWFFGHLDNTKIGDWIVKDAVSADGKSEKSVLHDRNMRISEVPNAVKTMKARAIAKAQEEAKKLAQLALALEQKAKDADKAAEALLAEWDAEEKEMKQTKSNKKKNNKKK